MIKHFFISILIIVTTFLGNAYANEFQHGITATVIVNKPSNESPYIETKEVYLIDLKLTPQQKRMILNYHPSKLKEMTYAAQLALPRKVFIGMNGVPVLNQGKYGTCVTFANTAAIDAILGKGDYISQVCNLTLGQYLQNNGDKILLHSGWWGSSGPAVLDQLMSFGIINKANQRTKSCGGLTDYPPNRTDISKYLMPLEEFQALHEDLFDVYNPLKIQWDSLLRGSERFNFNPANSIPPYDGDKILVEVKQFLATAAAKSKDGPIGIVTFGVMIPYQYCSIGACARYKAVADTWVITSAIDKIDPDNDRFKLAGHEMIIIGYDDDAVAIDMDGNKYQGLFILRNSFGDDVGDHGNYYMTYDFFKKFAMEVQVIYQPDYSNL